MLLAAANSKISINIANISSLDRRQFFNGLSITESPKGKELFAKTNRAATLTKDDSKAIKTTKIVNV